MFLVSLMVGFVSESESDDLVFLDLTEGVGEYVLTRLWEGEDGGAFRNKEKSGVWFVLLGIVLWCGDF